ncbi:ferric reductase like transmembrane component-domain-containing protein [Fomitopsis serialis]|uniref:ferric reductase like transmembrane component-domain-containing protein n=1 Tax=Fomitopsis serialis TaxID=139415 RepID=UPI002008A592|nr:ferric reductase like transmembrane component-domain-containing protein [Neoantrodia serialis]KAH9935347.1 ferric reductase like transmembrane component-domain-containing protein [Neoantrodia serialis]
MAASSVATTVSTAAASASTVATGAAAGAKAAGGAAAPPKLNSTAFFFEYDVILLFVVGLFVLLALPRMIARFMRSSEWFAGCFFHSVKIPRPSKFTTYPGGSGLSFSEKMVSSRADVESVYSRSEDMHTVNMAVGSGAPKNPPAYIPSWASLFPTGAKVLSTKIRPGYSLGVVVLMMGYLAVYMYSALFDVNLFTSPARLGDIAVSQMPTLYVLATKNNVLGTLIGKGYEKLNSLHRFVGRLVVGAVNLHALAYFAKWSQTGSISEHLEPNIICGVVALGCMDVLWLFSLSAVRQTYYNLFYVSHVVAGIAVLVFTAYHMPFAVTYMEIAGALYGFDRLVRLIQTRITTAHLHAMPELGATCIQVPSVNAGWRAGQHVRLRVLSTGMGPLGWTESHPFTIASVSKHPSEEGLVLMVKKAGDWTTSLYGIAQEPDAGEGSSGSRRVKVMLTGPFGGPGHAVVTSYSGAMLVSGGSGITYALATAQEILQKSAEGASRSRVVELVWSVTDPAGLKPLLPLFAQLLVDAQTTYTSLRISVFYTRAITSPDVLKTFERLPLGLTLTPGRPRLQKLLEGVADRTAGSGGVDGMTGVVVGVCGPPALGDEVGRVVRRLDPKRRKAVGGVELHSEYVFALLRRSFADGCP